MAGNLYDIPAWLDYAEFDNYESEERPTTNADFIGYATNQNKLLGALVANSLWQPKSNVVAGKIVVSPNMPAGMEAEALTGGETAMAEPSWDDNVKTYQDGGVMWLLRFKNDLKNTALIGAARVRTGKPTYGL